MRVTMKHREPVGADANTDKYIFYVRTSGETRKLLVDASKKLTQQFGATPSNSLVLHTLLTSFAAQNALEDA